MSRLHFSILILCFKVISCINLIVYQEMKLSCRPMQHFVEPCLRKYPVTFKQVITRTLKEKFHIRMPMYLCTFSYLPLEVEDRTQIQCHEIKVPISTTHLNLQKSFEQEENSQFFLECDLARLGLNAEHSIFEPRQWATNVISAYV